MSGIIKVTVLGLLIGLVACMQAERRVALESRASCYAACVKKLQICSRLCVNNCFNCQTKARCTAKREYRAYLNEIKMRNDWIMRDVKSYRDPLQCRKITCDCPADFSTCEQACGGVIHKHLAIAPYCA